MAIHCLAKLLLRDWWSLRLQQCKFTVKHKPEVDNVADFLIPHPIAKLFKANCTELCVNILTEHYFIRVCH